MEIEFETKKVKGGWAALVTSPIGSLPVYYDSAFHIFNAGTPDKMGNLQNLSYHEKLRLVRFYYEYDPVASRVIDKMIEIGITDLTLDRNDCTDEEYEVYKYVLPVFNRYLQDAALEYLLSGLVVPQTVWSFYSPMEIGVGIRRRLELPAEIQLINPDNIELEFDGFTNKIIAYFKVPDDLAAHLSGSKKNNKYAKFEEQYPQLAALVKKGTTKIPLEGFTIIRRRGKTYDPYPTPFLQAALEALEFKRNLRKMDYAIVSRVISAIQLIKLGNDNFPLTEDDEDQLNDLKNQMMWRSRPENIERVFQLFGNHTLNIEWVYPDTKAMLASEKYTSINEDIFYALAFPRILLSGETTRSATSQAEFAMFSPAETIKRVREAVLDYIDEVILEIKKRNNFQHRVSARFEELRLFDISKLTEIGSTLYEAGAISLHSLAKAGGYNYEDEKIMRAMENAS